MTRDPQYHEDDRWVTVLEEDPPEGERLYLPPEWEPFAQALYDRFGKPNENDASLDPDDPICLALRKIDPNDLLDDLFRQLIAPPKPKPSRKPRKPRLATVKKRAERAGLIVTGLTADGTVLFGPAATTTEANPWDEVFDDAAK
jgi:hypothetical protein